MAIVHQPRTHLRLHMLLWHLAGRWGRVTTDGIVIGLRLTHTLLADLVAARRPTVTVALAELERSELVRRVDGGLLLLGEPPGELLELRSLALPHAPDSVGVRNAAG
jgi:CRP-like cAMP-binding protein